MVLTRFFSALVAIPLLSLVIYVGGGLYIGVLFLLLMLATLEFSALAKKIAPDFSVWFFVILVGLTFLDGMPIELIPNNFFLLLAVIAIMARTLYRADYVGRKDGFQETWLTLSGVILIGWFGKHLLLLRLLDTNGAALFAVFAFVWAADTGAFFIGRRFGKRFFSPYVSPQKSVEGYLGGIVISLFVGLLFVWLFLPDFSFLVAILLGILLPIIAPIGDLAISLLKREAAVKEAGYLVPGHGGLLDRFDTILLGSAVGYYIIILIEIISYL